MIIFQNRKYRGIGFSSKIKTLSSYFFLVIICLFLFSTISFAQISDTQEIESSLSIESRGELRFYLILANGERKGSWRQDYDLDSPYVIQSSLAHDYQSLIIKNPLVGDYRIETDYRFEGIGESSISISYVHYEDQLYKSYTGELLTEHDNHNHLSFRLNDNPEAMMYEEDHFKKIQGLKVYKNDTDGNTKLVWLDISDTLEDFSHYRIYKKQENLDNNFILIGESQEPQWSSTIPWGSEQISPYVVSEYTSFAVSHVSHQGYESFLSEEAYNNDSDQDGFSDKQEEELGTDSYHIDTDRDTLDDFSEINRHHTNPRNADTDNDGIDDHQELQEGTSPRDPHSFPQDSCAPDNSENWYLNSDCSLDENTEIKGNLILSRNTLLTLKERITLWFNALEHNILMMIGSRIELKEGASIKSTH